MSLDKVLNRPLFRQQALKKGALKPVKARIGQMVGAPFQTHPTCLLYTSPSPRDGLLSRMPSSA